MITKIIITIFSFAAAVFMLFEKIIKNEKKPSKFEYIVFFILLITTGASGFQILEDFEKEKQTTIALNKENERMTKAIQHGIDSGLTANNKMLAEAFKHQSIDLDSLKQVLQKINKDTIKNNWSISSEIVPDINFTVPDGIKFLKKSDDTYEFVVSFSCLETQAKKVEIQLFPVIINARNEYSKINSNYIISNKNNDISNGVNVETLIKIHVAKNDSIKVLFLVAKGKYSNGALTKNYPLYSVRLFSMSELKISDMLPQSYPNVWRYLEPR